MAHRAVYGYLLIPRQIQIQKSCLTAVSQGIQNPGDFVSNVKQINNQSDLIWMTSFAGPSYFTIRSSVYIILIWDPCIFNLYSLCQTGSNYIRREPQQYVLHFNE